MPNLAVYPGSFDPFTLGHLDIAKRAAETFDGLTIVVVHNPSKTAMLSPQERAEAIRAAFGELPKNICVDVLETGLLANYCTKIGASVIVKGIRSNNDVDYEFPMARVNRDISGIETLMLPASGEYAHISSTLVRQVFELGGDASAYLPEAVARIVKEKLAK
jgi:pantetheine-phosphate adenylyltransferase